MSPPAVPGWAAAGISVALSVAFAAAWYPFLDAVPADFDEGSFMLQARSLLRGLRPFVDFASHDFGLHEQLLALAGRAFGETFVGFRMLPLLSVAGSGILVYGLVRPLAGSIPALAAQALFLASPGQTRALAAVPESPMVFLTLLGVYLLFQRETRASAYGAGLALVMAILVKPTCVLVAAAAAVSLAVARDWQRLKDLVVAGVIGAAAGVAWGLYATQGGLFTAFLYQAERFTTRGKGIWTIESGIRDMMRAAGIETPLEFALSSALQFFMVGRTLVPALLLALSLVGLVAWLRGIGRPKRALATFAVLWPGSLLLLNFAVADLASVRYFIPLLAASSFLLGGALWLGVRSVGPTVTVTASLLACGLLAQSSIALVREHDAWYLRRAQAIAAGYPEVLSFSPIFFAMTGREAGCGLTNPALTYGGFGEQYLSTAEGRRFLFTDERLIDCLRQSPDTVVMIDIGFYIFNRSGSRLRGYLDGEGARQRVFFSPEDRAQWDRPVPSLGLFR